MRDIKHPASGVKEALYQTGRTGGITSTCSTSADVNTCVPMAMTELALTKMDPLALRAVERIMAIVVGGLAIVLGYRLFLAVPEQRDGSGTFRLPWNITVGLARVGPGVFFALFGAAVVGYSLHGSMRITLGSGSGVNEVNAVGAMPVTSGGRSVQAERLNLRGEIEFLNTLDRKLRVDLSDEDQRAVRAHTNELKLVVMKTVWASDWGDMAAFREWTERGATGAPPWGTELAAEFFRSGQGEGQ
jgi:hypothetical protein